MNRQFTNWGHSRYLMPETEFGNKIPYEDWCGHEIERMMKGAKTKFTIRNHETKDQIAIFRTR